MLGRFAPREIPMTQGRHRTIYFHFTSVTSIRIDEGRDQRTSAPKQVRVQKPDGKDSRRPMVKIYSACKYRDGV